MLLFACILKSLHACLTELMDPTALTLASTPFPSLMCVQVGAYCNGRDSVSEYDCLLLQHLLWQRPEQADRINDWVVGQLSVDDGLKQVSRAQSERTLSTHAAFHSTTCLGWEWMALRWENEGLSFEGGAGLHVAAVNFSANSGVDAQTVYE